MNMRRLRLRHLEVLLAIERHGSITGAAEALGATQPAVSQWLAEVESAIGAQLFTRGRQIQPTAFLPVALRHARRIVADSHQLQYELQAVASGSAGSVRMGVMRVAAVRLVPQALLQIGKLPQKPLVHVVEDIAAGLWARFDRQELDLIVGRLDERAFRPHVRCEALFDDAHAIVAGPAHPLARRKKVDWREAAACPWILPPPETGLRRAIDASFVDNGLAPPQPWLESASATVTEEILQQTECLGVMSGAAAERGRRRKDLAVLPLQLGTDVGPVGVVWEARESSPALDAVLRALRDCAAGRSG